MPETVTTVKARTSMLDAICGTASKGITQLVVTTSIRI
jgi:hypothetical protein